MQLRECDCTKLPLKRSLVGDPSVHDTIAMEKLMEKERAERSPNSYARFKTMTRRRQGSINGLRPKAVEFDGDNLIEKPATERILENPKQIRREHAYEQ